MGKRSNRRRGTLFERELSKLLHADRVPLSGAGALKGDVVVPIYSGAHLMIEAKSTSSRAYTIQLPTVEKLIAQRQAMVMYGVVAALLAVRVHGYTTPLLFCTDEDAALIAERFQHPLPLPNHYGLHDVASNVTVSPTTVASMFPVRFLGSAIIRPGALFETNPARAVLHWVPTEAFLPWLQTVREHYGFQPRPSIAYSPMTVHKRRSASTPVERLLHEMDDER